MSSASGRKQDMPPPGGYGPIHYKRVPARTYFSGRTLIGSYLGTTAGAAYVYFVTRREIHREAIERRSIRFAIFPLLLAERDREYLKQLRRNRNEEAELMKNVEGWKVGMFYDEPIYNLLPEGKMNEPSYVEYYVHTHFKHFAKRAQITWMS